MNKNYFEGKTLIDKVRHELGLGVQAFLDSIVSCCSASPVNVSGMKEKGLESSKPSETVSHFETH